MKRGESAGEGGITADRLKSGADIALEKLAVLFSECLNTQKVPIAWKNDNIILLHNKGDPKGVKNFTPISLLSAVYS